MFAQLLNHNEDLKKLVEKGYAIALDSNCIIVRDIPYLDDKLNLKIATIVAKIEFKDQLHIKPVNHQVYFSGTSPYGLNGSVIPKMGDNNTSLSLSSECNDFTIQRIFSNKPQNGFKDFYELIESYVRIISGPAMEKFDITPYTFRCIKKFNNNSVFKFHDTLSSRAEITDLSKIFENEKVAIIGMGGTGCFIYDFLVRTPIQEIQIFDGKRFYIHNSFRSPGKQDENEFNKFKVDVYKARYENFREGIIAKPIYIDRSSASELEGITFAFVCVDKGAARGEIFDLLISLGIPFIDVGMGLKRRDSKLSGMVRTTSFQKESAKKIRKMKLAPDLDDPNDEYRTNIQIGEMNALNACLAVIKYKQLKGFYFAEESPFHILMGIGDLKLIGEIDPNEDES